MPFRHNKKRNTGLVYEFLVRRLGQQLVDQDPAGARRAVQVTQRYFGAGQPLSEELELFRAIVGTRGVSPEAARRVLVEVGRRATKTDVLVLNAKKGSLIRDLHREFGRDFFDRHRLPQYRLLASVQLFIDGNRGKRISESVQAIQLEDGLVRWMTSVPSGAQKDVDRRVDELVCMMAQRRFDEKYGSSLSPRQKSLLEAYVKSLVTEDSSSLRKMVAEDKKAIGRVLVDSFGKREVQEDRVMKERYIDAARRLAELDVSRADERVVEEMMLFHRLAEELTSDE